MKKATEECYKCGGMGGEPGSNFGDYGFHPCYRCGASGYLPAGTREREEAAYESYQEPPHAARCPDGDYPYEDEMGPYAPNDYKGSHTHDQAVAEPVQPAYKPLSDDEIPF